MISLFVFCMRGTVAENRKFVAGKRIEVSCFCTGGDVAEHRQFADTKRIEPNGF